jgi:hypothetical protein
MVILRTNGRASSSVGLGQITKKLPYGDGFSSVSNALSSISKPRSCLHIRGLRKLNMSDPNGFGLPSTSVQVALH